MSTPGRVSTAERASGSSLDDPAAVRMWLDFINEHSRGPRRDRPVPLRNWYDAPARVVGRQVYCSLLRYFLIRSFRFFRLVPFDFHNERPQGPPPARSEACCGVRLNNRPMANNIPSSTSKATA
jgi:hypothetical protein